MAKTDPDKLPAHAKLTDEVRDRLFKAIKLGASLEVACNASGVSYRTVTEWRQIGEGRHPTKRPRAPYKTFAADINRAIAESEMSLLTTIQRAAQADARHAQWILERRFPERWANTQKIQAQVDIHLEQSLDTIFAVLERELRPEDYERAIAAISIAAGGSEAAAGD